MTSDPRSGDPFPPASPTEPFSQPVGPVTPASPLPGPATRTKVAGAGVLVNLLLGVALVVAVGGVAFAVGRATAPAAVAATGPGGGRFDNGGNGGNGPFFGPNASGGPNGNGGIAGGPGGILGAGGVSIEGTVTAVSADSITLQLANGQSVTIPVNGDTTYHSQTPATAGDVKTGSTVLIQLEGGRGAFTGNGNGNNGNGNGNGGPAASGQPTRTLPTARSITLAPAGS